MLVTPSLAIPRLNPAAEAEMFACCSPSARPSSIPETMKVIEACPAGMVALSGTVAYVVSLLASTTTSGSAVCVLRVTVPVIVWPAETAAAGNVTFSAGPSASVTSSESELWPVLSTTPESVCTRAVISTVLSPVTWPSSMAVTENVAEVRPTGITSRRGTVTADVSLLLKAT